MAYFSVVITVFNKEMFIQNTLNSVLNQTFTDFEIVIVNDGSTDTTETVILTNNDPRIRYFKKENEGAAAARNFGIKTASNDYICLLDGDDFWFPTYLEEMFQIIIKRQEANIFCCAVEAEYENKILPNNYTNISNKEVQLVNYFDTSLKNTILTSSSVIIRKDVFKKVGYFDTTIKSGQDTDFWVRIGLHYSIVFLNKILVRYTFDKKSLSRSKKDFGKSLNFEKFESEEKTNPQLKKFLDLNRYSLALKAKMQRNIIYYNKYSSAINYKNLSFKKRCILKVPAFILDKLIILQRFLVTIGISKSVFK